MLVSCTFSIYDGVTICHLLSIGDQIMRTLLASLAVIFSLQASVRSEYSPGTPGGAWSEAELLTVRAKLWRMYSNNQAVFNWWRKDKIPNDLPDPSFKADLGFCAAKVVRLRWV